MKNENDFKSSISNLVSKRKSNSNSTDRGNSILDLHKTIAPLYESVVVPTVGNINNELTRELGEDAPSLKLVSNIAKVSPELNRNFIQIVYHEKNKEINPLTDPYLLIEAEPSGRVSFVKSDFTNVEELDGIEDIYSPDNQFQQKFNSSFQQFLDSI